VTDTAHVDRTLADNNPEPSRLGRRKMILGVAAAGVGASVVAGAEPASATDGSALIVGKANTAKATTSVTTTTGNGLEGTTSAGEGQVGVEGIDTSSTGGYGVVGLSSAGVGVAGFSEADGKYAVAGNDTSTGGGYALYGLSTHGTGVYGTSATLDGVLGNSTGEGSGAVVGIASGKGGIGVFAYATGPGASSVGTYTYSKSSHALLADGSAEVVGTLSKGGGSFKIDHPLDPGGKYLYHSFVESPDMMNVYNGTVTLDGKGQATVELPEWFQALNRDYRYQLTAIGSPAPELHVSREVEDGTFSIAGGKAEQKVSWQVTGIRQDAWANANRIPVEVEKPEEDRGRYLHPELFGGEAITSLAKARDRSRRGRHVTPA
jgi:hypothetical protein